MQESWKPAVWITIGLVLGLLVSGVILLLCRQPRGMAITLQPLPSPKPVVVQVSGAIRQPGVYELPAGSRVETAVLAAGGLLSSADEEGINLAAPLQDGQQMLIPTRPAASPTGQPAGQKSAAVISLPAAGSPLIDINTATQAELETLPRIGPATAQKIIQYRTEHGPFKAVESIVDVPGIGPTTFELIKDQIIVR